MNIDPKKNSGPVDGAKIHAAPMAEALQKMRKEDFCNRYRIPSDASIIGALQESAESMENEERASAFSNFPQGGENPVILFEDQVRHAAENPHQKFFSIEEGFRALILRHFQGKVAWEVRIPIGSLIGAEAIGKSVRENLENVARLADKEFLFSLANCLDVNEALIVISASPTGPRNAVFYSSHLLMTAESVDVSQLRDEEILRRIIVPQTTNDFESWRHLLWS